MSFARLAPAAPRDQLHHFTPSKLDVKTWRSHDPTVDAVRPAKCPRCGAASRQPGRNIVLHGHGRRERQQRGQALPGGPPVVTGVWLRRYECQACKAICVVGPADIAPRYLYSAPAIAWAIALYGISRMSVPKVRRCVAVWQRIGATAHGRWSTLQRWLRDVKQARLFAGAAHITSCHGLRRFAEALAACIAAQAPPECGGMTLSDRAFFAARCMRTGAHI